jgi:hypothetical protein
VLKNIKFSSDDVVRVAFEFLMRRRRCSDLSYIYNENKRIMTQFEQSNENLSFELMQLFAFDYELKRQASGVTISVITLC